MRNFVFIIAVCTVIAFAAPTHEPGRNSNGAAIRLTKQASLLSHDHSVDFYTLANFELEWLSAKILRGFENYEKNTGRRHPFAVKGNKIHERQAGVLLKNDRRKVWYAEISIGTPPQTLNVEIDTGSTDIFVPESLCDETCDGHTRWDADSSTSAQSQRKFFDLTFADQSTVMGIQYHDNLTIAGFTADTQTIGGAVYYSALFEKRNFAADGVLGMAFTSMSGFPAIPLFSTLLEERKVIKPVFSIALTPTGGELYIGGSNRDMYNGEFTYTPVTHQGFWQVVIDSVQNVRGKELLQEVPAIIDTGTTLVVGDTRRVSNLYTTLGGVYEGRGYYSFRCNAFPVVKLSFGGKPFVIPTATLNRGPVAAGSPNCFSGIVAKDTGSGFWIVGAVFLQSVYTIFDNGTTPRVGFATPTYKITPG